MISLAWTPVLPLVAGIARDRITLTATAEEVERRRRATGLRGGFTDHENKLCKSLNRKNKSGGQR